MIDIIIHVFKYSVRPETFPVSSLFNTCRLENGLFLAYLTLHVNFYLHSHPPAGDIYDARVLSDCDGAVLLLDGLVLYAAFGVGSF